MFWLSYQIREEINRHPVQVLSLENYILLGMWSNLKVSTWIYMRFGTGIYNYYKKNKIFNDKCISVVVYAKIIVKVNLIVAY